MQKHWWVGGLVGLVLLSTSCGRDEVSQNAEPTQPAVGDEVAAIAPAASPVAPVAAGTLPIQPVPATPPQAVPVPDLIPPTGATARVPQVAAGRTDPFAAVANNPIVTATAPRNPVPVPTPSVAPAPPPQVTTVPLSSIPLPQVAPAPTDVSQLPPVAVAPARPTPTSLATTIEVSGIVQAGDRTSAIVRVPSESTSRYVHVGDRLANGRILVKRIEVAADAEPIVILEQDGVEVIRTVGSGNGMVGLL